MSDPASLAPCHRTALGKLGCRPHDTRMFPTWKLALNITWCFDLEFEGGVHA